MTQTTKISKDPWGANPPPPTCTYYFVLKS